LIIAILALIGVAAYDRHPVAQLQPWLHSAHSLRISEMRQAWTNNLRDAMATFQSYGVTPI
jgi:hypothetical protein